ncbi:MAG: hypothetical protein J7576_00180 [Siphonobacter aquaeclarae]|nr:hypothetical protein [Siphonobacter aquaeclarae]
MRQSLLFRLFNVLMVFVVLASSTGFGLVEHTCHIRGNKKVVLLTENPKGCPVCAPAKVAAGQKETVKKDKCCEEETRYEHVSYTSSLTKLAAGFVKMVAEAAVSIAFFFFHLIADTLSALLSSASVSHAAIPLSGRDLLVFVQSFLI